MEATLWDTFFEVGRTAFAQGDLVQAQEAFRAAVSAASEEPGDARLAMSLNNLAAVRHAQGHLPDALNISEEALRVSRATLGDNHAEVGVGWINLAQLLAAGGRYGESEASYLAGLQILEKATDLQPYREALEDYANMQLGQEKLERALETFTRLSVSLAKAEPESSEWLARTQHMLSNLHDALGHSEEAIRCRQECLDRLHQLWGHSLDMAQVVLNMADSLFGNQQFGEAASHYGHGVKILEASFPKDDPRLTSSQMNWLVALKESGEVAEALTLANRLLATWSPQSEELPRLYNEHGLLLFLRESYPEALASFKQALGIWEERGGQTPASRTSCLYNLASAALGAREWEEAREFFQSALSMAEEHLTLQHALSQRILLNYQHLLTNMGLYQEARELEARLENISSEEDA